MRAEIGSWTWGLDCDHAYHRQEQAPSIAVDVPDTDDPQPVFTLYDRHGREMYLRPPSPPPLPFGFAAGLPGS